VGPVFREIDALFQWLEATVAISGSVPWLQDEGLEKKTQCVIE
jgi:hypothetical protein